MLLHVEGGKGGLGRAEEAEAEAEAEARRRKGEWQRSIDPTHESDGLQRRRCAALFVPSPRARRRERDKGREE